MKTLQDLYTEITSDEKLKAAFLDAAKDGKTLDFLAARGCETTAEELAAFLKDQASGEVSDAELDNVAGGGCNSSTERETIFSCISFGLYCAGAAVASAMDGHVGQKTDVEGRLCTHEGKLQEFCAGYADALKT